MSYYSGAQGGYGQQYNYNQSHDASGSDTTGPWNNSTDPSSENSSLDRAHGIMKPAQTPEPMNGYGPDNFGNDAIMEEGGADEYGNSRNMRRAQNNGYGAGNAGPPPPCILHHAGPFNLAVEARTLVRSRRRAVSSLLPPVLHLHRRSAKAG